MSRVRTPGGPATVIALLAGKRTPASLMIGEKVMLLVTLAGTALALVLGLTVLFGASNERKLRAIIDTHYPAVQLSQRLRELLVEVNHELRGGVSTRDPEFLLSADSLSKEFLRLASADSVPGAHQGIEAPLIRASFERYFRHARTVSERLIQGETSEADVGDLVLMRGRFDSTRHLIDLGAAAARARIDQAFIDAHRQQRAAWMLVAIITLISLLAIGRLSRSAVQRLTTSMQRAVEVADRLAQGDIDTRIESASNDEVGQLLRALQRTLEYLGEMATHARAIAAGDLSARPRPRSDADVFGNAFARMTESLTDTAAVARRIAGGDLSVRIELRSPKDGFGTALTGMVASLTRSIEELRVSEQRNRELAGELFASRERLEQLLSSSPAVIYSRAFNAQAPLTFVSGNASASLGVGPDDLQKDPALWTSRLHADDRSAFDAALSRLLATGASSVEYRMRHVDGSIRWIQDQATVVQHSGAGAREIVGSWVDVTDRHKAVESLRVSEEQLRMAQRLEAVGQLAGGVAHDFNNLLTAILSYSEILLSEIPADDPKREDVAEITKAALRAASLTQQLLTFSRKQVRQTQVIDVDGIVGDMEKMLRRLIGEHIEFTTCTGSHGAHVRADHGQVEQILVNLAVNARDAMPRGGRLTIATRAIIVGDGADAGPTPDNLPAGSYVVLEVADTGCGMDRATQERVFEPFFTTKPVGQGTGLGLATVYGIVQQSGGQIHLRSEPGRGSTFSIYLPSVEAVADTPHPDAQPLPRRRQSETVLLAEDDEVLRKLTRKILERDGYTVLEARNGEEALVICSDHPAEIDLVVTDVVMPLMGGRPMMDRLRRQRPATKVLFMSGYTDGNIGADGITEPGTGFLGKPFTPTSLVAKVREVLDGAAPRTPTHEGGLEVIVP